jgi:AcrR family transcriptional regulator
MTNQIFLDILMASDTRARIISAAYRTLVRDGYEATSVKDIAMEAGIAPGLVHYHFASKDELLVAAVRHGCSQIQQTQQSEVAQSLKDCLYTQRDFNKLFLAMLGVALHNPGIAEAVRDFIREQRTHLEGVVHDAFPSLEGGVVDMSGVAAAFWGGIIGILIQDLLDPEFEAHAAVDALTAMALGDESKTR